MLFDLRSRRRRHTVRVVYILLALVMLLGLVLVGVGTGNNNGGLLNAFTNNGSGNGQNQAFSQATKAAITQTDKHPDSASDWATLVQARWSEASSGSNYDATTGTYTTSGKAQLAYAASAWRRYITLSADKPSFENATLGARIYQALGQWDNAYGAWQYVIRASTGSAGLLNGYICTALNAYAAKLPSAGGFAASTALKVAPKADRLELQSAFKAAKGSASTAAQYVVSDC